MTDAKKMPHAVGKVFAERLGRGAHMFIQELITDAINTKMDEILSAVQDNFAAFDSDGRVEDSGLAKTTGSVVGTTDTQTLTNKTIAAVSLTVGDATNYAELKADGEINLHGTARITKKVQVEPGTVTLPGLNRPTADTEDGFLVHRYDRDTEQSAYYLWKIPADYDAAEAVGVLFEFIVENPPSGAGNEAVVMGCEYKKLSEDDVFDFGSGTTSATCTETLTDGETAKIVHVTPEISLTTTGFAAGDIILFRFFRDATNVADTFDSEAVVEDNDVWVTNYQINYLSDRLGEVT